MKGTPHRPLLFSCYSKEKISRNYFKEGDSEEPKKGAGMVRKGVEGESGGEIDEIADTVQCITLHKSATNRSYVLPGEKISLENYDLWRKEQKTRAPRLGKQLKARWELEELIEEQLNRFQAHYNHAMVPTQPKDLAQLLMPRWKPPHELAAISWLADWRPSAILDLVRGLVGSSSSLSSPSSSSSSKSSKIERLLSQVIHEIRIEEAIIDAEMSEIQATCVLHLPFALPNQKQSGGCALDFIQEEFKKIKRVITRAQQLRFKAVELVVKKVLSQTNAVEFFVAFAEIQDVIRQVAELQKSQKVLFTLPDKALLSGQEQQQIPRT